MSSTYGPYALTAGQRQQVNLGGTPGTIRISNQSTSLDLFVSFAQVPPTSSVAGGDWDLVVHAGWAESVPLTDASLTPYALGKAWQGYLWVMPISNAAQLAQNGTVPSLANVYVTTYEPGEPAPNSSSPGPIAVASTSQQRVISVPIVPDTVLCGTLGVVTAGGAAVELVTGGTRVNINDPSPLAGSAQVWPIIYGFSIDPFSGNDYDNIFDIQAALYDNNGVKLSGPFNLYTGTMWNYGTPKTRQGARWSGPPLGAVSLLGSLGAPYPWTVRFFLNWRTGPGNLPGCAFVLAVSAVNFAPSPGLLSGLVPPIGGGSSRGQNVVIGTGQGVVW